MGEILGLGMTHYPGMTMQAQKNLPKDPSVLRSIVKEANQNLGIYASVSKSGRVSEGDRVELL